MSRRDIKKVLEAALSRGWKDVTPRRKGNNHFVLEHPSGARVTAPFSPSCHRAHKNLAADIRRAEKRLDGGGAKPYSRDK